MELKFGSLEELKTFADMVWPRQCTAPPDLDNGRNDTQPTKTKTKTTKKSTTKKQEPPKTETKQETEQTGVTMDDLKQLAIATIKDNRQKVTDLLENLGVERVTSIPKDKIQEAYDTLKGE